MIIYKFPIKHINKNLGNRTIERTQNKFKERNKFMEWEGPNAKG